LHLGTAAFDLRDALRGFCRHVEHVPEQELRGRGTDVVRLRFAARSIDLATLYGGEPTLGLLAELRRVLRPEACALIAVGNRWSAHRLRHRGQYHAGAASAAILAAMALRTGFTSVSRYWVEPSLKTPRSFVPIAPGRSRLLEQMRTRERGPSSFHAAALALGMPQLLYPALMMVVRA
jgi:SAM-dependent methyltransferase